MKNEILLVAIVTALSTTRGQRHGWDMNVCRPLNTSQNDLIHKRPYLPKQFSLRVEANIIDKNYTTDVREWYDEINNRGSLEQYDSGIKVYAFYDYDLNDLVVVVPLPNSDFQCTVTDLSKDPNRFIFGSKTYANGTDRIYTAAGALRFGGSQPEKYMGVKTVRGIQCDMWQSCTYWQDMDATMTVKWYFSRPDWLTSQTLPQLPVRCHVTGKIWTNGTARNFEHVYEFSEYRDGLDGETRRFETPQGAYCKGMKTRLKPPVPATTFTFGAEVQVPEKGTITYMKEYYNQDAKLVKIEYKPNNFGIGTTSDRTTEIHDFNTGVAYIMDEVNNNCTVTPISATGFDSEADGKYVRMRSSSEFFFTNKTSFIAYEGLRTIRGIECDVWIADKDNWPIGNPLNSTWEWYFARTEWQSNAGYAKESKMPVAIFITIHTKPAEHFQYNIYDFDDTSGKTWNYDVSSCYQGRHKQLFRMLLKGNFTAEVLSNEMYFKTFVIVSLYNTIPVSPLRIADLDLDHNDHFIKVTFNVLDVAPNMGDIPNFPKQISLADFSRNLTQALRQGTLVVAVPTPSLKQMITLTAIPFSDPLWGYQRFTAAPLVTSQPDEEPEDVPIPEMKTKEDALEFEKYKSIQENENLDVIHEDPKTYMMDDDKPRIEKRSISQDGIELSALGKCQAPPAGYSPGALAGIALGMLVLGFFVCFGAILIGSKFGTRQARNQGYEMT